VEFGVHLPLADLGHGLPTSTDLRAYATAAAECGFDWVAANDHLVWRRPWLDGPTALAAVSGSAAGLTRATTVALPAVRHPVVLAKTLSSLAALSSGRLVAGLGPGSSEADHRAVGVPFEERWARFDEGFRVVRALLRGEPAADGEHYRAGGVVLDPLPSPAPQVWLGSWGSDIRLRSLAGVADGWLASAYNTTPQRFAEARARLDGHLTALGRDPGTFPDTLATTWLYVTDDAGEARRVLEQVLAPLLQRDPVDLAARLPVGSPDHCLRVVDGYAAAGAQRMLLWPVRDPIDQLEVFARAVRPHVTGRTHRPGGPDRRS
jgi:alkanesulfonate monooxygenase SsuD/methylene tetrahydromethanopterin reductase-like flavin-dependent oxidoreductase (luciferase family)